MVLRSENLLILANFQFPVGCLIAQYMFLIAQTDFPIIAFLFSSALTVAHLLQDNRVVQSYTVFSIYQKLSGWCVSLSNIKVAVILFIVLLTSFISFCAEMTSLSVNQGY